MKQNLGMYDRLFRLFIGVGFVCFGLYTGSGFATLGGLFSIYEALASWCIVYQLIGHNTCPLPSAQKQKLNLLPTYLQGIIILGVAIGLNFFASFMKWQTWYGLLQNQTTLSIDNALFLFIVYPFLLGLTVKYSRKFLG